MKFIKASFILFITIISIHANYVNAETELAPCENCLQCYYDYNKENMNQGFDKTYVAYYANIDYVLRFYSTGRIEVWDNLSGVWRETYDNIDEIGAAITLQIESDKYVDLKFKSCPKYFTYDPGHAVGTLMRFDETFDKHTDVTYKTYKKIYDWEVNEGNSYDFRGNSEVSLNKCESLLGKPSTKGTPAYYLVFVFEVLKFIAIGILLVFSVIEFTSALASHDNDIINKTLQKTVKRFIICVIIFVLPSLLSLLLELFDKIPADMCGIK